MRRFHLFFYARTTGRGIHVVRWRGWHDARSAAVQYIHCCCCSSLLLFAIFSLLFAVCLLLLFAAVVVAVDECSLFVDAQLAVRLLCCCGGGGCCCAESVAFLKPASSSHTHHSRDHKLHTLHDADTGKGDDTAADSHAQTRESEHEHEHEHDGDHETTHEHEHHAH